jgi:hypothetical protein
MSVEVVSASHPLLVSLQLASFSNAIFFNDLFNQPSMCFFIFIPFQTEFAKCTILWQEMKRQCPRYALMGNEDGSRNGEDDEVQQYDTN